MKGNNIYDYHLETNLIQGHTVVDKRLVACVQNTDNQPFIAQIDLRI